MNDKKAEILKLQLKYDRSVRSNKKAIDELLEIKSGIEMKILDKVEGLQQPSTDIWVEAFEYGYCLRHKKSISECGCMILA